MFKFILIAALVTCAYGHSYEAAQTDWSGGPGVPGPVTNWDSAFDSENGVIWWETPGEIHLGVIILNTPVEFTVDSDFDGARSVCADDVDGDGDIDILAIAGPSDDISWWSNDDGTGSSWTDHIIDDDFLPVYSIYAEDVDGDDDTDVLAASPKAGNITWWSNDDGVGTSWTAHPVGGGFNSLHAVYAADVDGDGDTDVMGAASDFGGIYLWLNDDGSGTSWTLYMLSWRYLPPSSVYAEDLDGDDDLDILATSPGSDAIAWWSNDDGSGTTWTEHGISSAFGGAGSVYAADVDGDDDIDVLGAASDANEIAWWENVDGAGISWTEHGIDDNFDHAVSVYAADLDGDNDVDVLGAAAYADDITWWSNDDGSGTSWTERIINEDFDGASSVCAEDVDGDGYMDAIGAAVNADDVSWWKTVESPMSAALISSIYDTMGSPEWNRIDWTDNTPEGTTVKFQLKASDYWNAMGDWSSEITAHPFDFEGFIENGLRYIQYRAILETTEPGIFPTLEDITIDWGYTGIALTSFSAESAADGVNLTWECGDSVAGFNLYRAAAGKTKTVSSRNRVNADLITGESPYEYLDTTVEKDVNYNYWLEAIDVNGSSETFGPVECTWRGALPTAYALYQSRPNPAPGTATIAFDLPETAPVTLTVYDVSGRKVTTVVDETLMVGNHERTVSGLAPGVYFYRLKAGDFDAVRKMVVVESDF